MAAETLREAFDNRMQIGDAGLGARLYREASATSAPPGVLELWNREAPEKIERLHREDRQAGAEILVTNSFRADAASLRAWKLEGQSKKFAKLAGQIARSVAAGHPTPAGDGYVLGSLGPGPGDDESPRAEDHEEAALGLLKGGVDGVLIETIRHGARAAAIVEATERASARADGQPDLPLLLSFTPDAEGRLGCGSMLEEVVERTGERAFAFGLNCVPLDEERLAPLLERLAAFGRPLFLAPNPPAAEAPELFAKRLLRLARRHSLALVRACCGSDASHVAALHSASRT